MPTKMEKAKPRTNSRDLQARGIRILELEQIIAERDARIAKLEDRCGHLNADNKHSEAARDVAVDRLATMRYQYAALKEQFDRLRGYTDRIVELETPPERRLQGERRQRPQFDPNPVYDPGPGYDHFGNKRERTKEWYE